MDNTDFELVWRSGMVRTLVTCALRELRWRRRDRPFG